MNSKQQTTLDDIFRDPVLSSICWADIERLFVALGARISEGNGSRVRVALNGRLAIFHRPHPEKETDKGCVNPFDGSSPKRGLQKPIDILF